jgi:hypothetical protein
VPSGKAEDNVSAVVTTKWLRSLTCEYRGKDRKATFDASKRFRKGASRVDRDFGKFHNDPSGTTGIVSSGEIILGVVHMNFDTSGKNSDVFDEIRV